MKKLSIIIPMYNATTSIGKCLESTQRQDLPETDYEVIVINDGSTDDSLTIVKEIAKGYNNVRIYSQSNGGLSVARNAGLDRAKGDYIMFIDSDDWIEENCLRKIVISCEENNLDLLRICSANVIDGVSKRRFSLKEGKVVLGSKVLLEDIPACAPFTIYRRAFLNKHCLRFFPGIYHEDNEFTPRAYYFAERVSGINDIVYYVYQTQGSITRSINVKKPLDVTIVIQNLDDFCTKYVKESDKHIFHRIIAVDMNSALHQTLEMNDSDRKRVNEAFYRIRHLFTHARISSKRSYCLAGWLYTVFPHHVVEVYSLLHGKICYP